MKSLEYSVILLYTILLSDLLSYRYSDILLCFTIVTRSNIVWNLARGYCLCHCKTFLLVPDSTECTKFLLPKSAVHYLCHLKSNNIIGQRKTTNKEKHFYPWLTSNWLRVISCQEQFIRLLVVIHHENIHELASLRFLNLNLE